MACLLSVVVAVVVLVPAFFMARKDAEKRKVEEVKQAAARQATRGYAKALADLHKRLKVPDVEQGTDSPNTD